MITVPAFALHHMEEYYPDPEKFDPERFALLHKVKGMNRRSKSTYFKVESRE